MSETVEEFHLMDLDQRIIKAIAELHWQKPTDIQQAVIPLFLEGKNILVKARTGSGKTGSYAVPLLHQLLQRKEYQIKQQTTALIITPSKELCNQAYRNIKELAKYCTRNVSYLDIAAQKNVDTLKPLLAEQPDIIIATPSKLLAQLRAFHVTLDHLVTMVIDEADLVFSFGHQDDMKDLKSFITSTFQAVLMSATLDVEVKSLRRDLLKGTVWCRVELPEENLLPPASQLTQYIIRAEETDKFVILSALFKLKLIRGKTLIFTNTVDRCYRLRLFLEEFGIRSVILNCELPVASRCHTVDQFNRGVYDILLASDETAADPAKNTKGRSKKQKRPFDTEFGVSRGIDFMQVSNAINFDFPTTPLGYIHRVGRTARADQRGTALSLVNMKETEMVEQVEKLVLGPAVSTSDKKESIFKPFQFRMEEIDGFRYRAQDAMIKVTRYAIREARMKEIKSELLNAEKLKGYFEDNRVDLHILRHDKGFCKAPQPELKDVPDYIVPSSLRDMMSSGGRDKRRRLAKAHRNSSRGGRGGMGSHSRGGGRGGASSRGRVASGRGGGAAQSGGAKKRKAENPLFTFKTALGSKKKK